MRGDEGSVDKIASVYCKAGADGQFSGRFYNTTHRFSREMQDDAFAFSDDRLKA